MQTTDRAVKITALGLNKSLKQAIIDGDLSGGGGGGGGIIEVFNATVANSTGATSLTGVAYFKAPQGMTINKVVLQIYEKGSITTGSLTMDLKKNTTPDSVGMASIFTTLPTINFTTATNYQTNSGVLNTGATTLADGDWIRLDFTSIPTGLTKWQIVVYGA